MLTPSRTAPPPASEVPAAERGPGSSDALRRWVLGLGVLALLAAFVFPFAPVTQPEVRYTWNAADGAAAIPLMPYQPVALTAAVECATARSAGPGTVLLTTTPLRPDPAAYPLAGLRLTAEDGAVAVSTGGVELGRVALPSGACTLSVTSDPRGTRVLVDGTTVLTRDGDVRPAVVGAFSDLGPGAGGGTTLALTADTRFQTTITPLKAVVAAVGVLALLGLLVALGRADARRGRSVRLLPRRWWRPRLVDVAVAALLGGWWAIGAVTVDDGYIAGIVRSRGENGVIGNVYRWLNAPESPFSWFYDLLHPWSQVSPSTAWMRLPATLLGLVIWVVLARCCLPRLGPFARHRATPWVAALAFGTWWVPLCLGLRPEPWVAAGLLGCWVAVERAVAARGLLPLAVGLVLAGATTALTPGGLIAFTPFVAGAAPVVRLLRVRGGRGGDLGRWPLVAALVAAPASAVLLMVYDQSLAAMVESTRVRSLIGGGAPWYAEPQRYAELMSDSFQGSIGRRAAVLVTLLAAVGVLVALSKQTLRRRTGIAAGPARRLVVAFLLALAVMTFTPTKWTQHFGDLASLGAAVLVLGAATWARPALRTRPRAFVGGLAAATVVGALVVAGLNSWPFVGGWFGPSFSTVPVQVRDVPVATLLLVAGGIAVVALLGRAVWRATGPPRPHAAGPVEVAATAEHGGAAEPGMAVGPGGAAEPGGAAGPGGAGAREGSVDAVPRLVPGPVPVLVFVLVVALGVQVLGLARVAVAHRDSYTLAADTLATLRGDPCGLQRTLSVETDPAAGLLPAATPPATAPATPPEQSVDIGGSSLPGLAVAGQVTTGWFTLDPAQRSGALPVVVTTVGALRPGDDVRAEFADANAAVIADGSITTATAAPTDVRLFAPAAAVSVRLVVAVSPAGTASRAQVTLPRVPRLTPMEQLLPRGTRAILDWPIAFLFPCLVPAALPDGTAALPTWRVAPTPSDPSAGITYAPGFGGPFAPTRLLVTQQRLPTYLAGDWSRDAVQLFRWRPVAPLRTPTPTVSERTVAGWVSDGHARVPGLDPVG